MQLWMPGLKTEPFTAKAQRRKGKHAKENMTIVLHRFDRITADGSTSTIIMFSFFALLCVPFASLRLCG
jgi:hypothetical protein